MAKAILLTDAKILALSAPSSGQLEISDAKVPGLRLRLGTSGAKTFILRKRIGTRLRNITLGRYNPRRFSLADARKKARTFLSDIEAGLDPTSPLAAPPGSIQGMDTIRSLWSDYKAFKAYLRSAAEVERIFERYILPTFGDRLADTITRGEVTRLVDNIARTAPVMARAVHAQLSSFYTWALPRLDRLPGNPCRDAGRPPKPKSRKRVLSERELVGVWRIAENQSWPWNIGVKLLILTGQRRAEVFEADCAEFNLDAAMWTIPAERAKNGVEHLVPLTTRAIAELRTAFAASDGGKLFPARGNLDRGPGGLSKAVTRIRALLQKELGTDVPNWTLHDLRRTMATSMQRLGVRLEVVEAILNHVSGSRGGIAGVYQLYNFLDEKRVALEAWERDLECMLSRSPYRSLPSDAQKMISVSSHRCRDGVV